PIILFFSWSGCEAEPPRRSSQVEWWPSLCLTALSRRFRFGGIALVDAGRRGTEMGATGAPPPSSASSSRSSTAPSSAATALVPFIVALFFAWGFATVLIDTLIPKLKGLFSLNYAEAMLTQFAFFIAYLLISAPAGMLLARIGYLRAIVVGLFVMAGGCLLFSPAASAGVYGAFLAALFIMA